MTCSRIAAGLLAIVIGLTGCHSRSHRAPPTFSVTYDGNEATEGSVPVDTTRYTPGQRVTVLGNPGALARSGYGFAGWNTLANGAGTTYTQGQLFEIGQANVRLYARWTALPTFRVTYDANGATGGAAPADSTRYLAGQSVIVQGNGGALAKAGFSFSGWSTAADGTGTVYTQGQTLAMGTADLVLYARWTALPTHTVTYDGNGATTGSVPVDTTHYLDGQAIAVLGNGGNLGRPGYAFGGWSTQADGGGVALTPGQTLDMGSADLTLYARWLPTRAVTYDPNGATGGAAPTDPAGHLPGDRVTVPDGGTLVREGYSFSGWNTQADGSGTTYVQGQTFGMGSVDVTLYARWTALPTYVVSYGGNGATSGGAPTDTTHYLPGQSALVQDNTGALVRTGYRFSGWSTVAEGAGVTYTPGQTLVVGEADVVLYARWTALPTYAVTYDANGASSGSVPVDATSYLQAQGVTALGNPGNLRRTGYAFAGWNTQPDGGGTTIAQGQTFPMGSSDLTLYARWLPTFTVSYQGDGATDGAAPVDDAGYLPGDRVTVAGAGTLTRAGYAFSGWSTQPGGAGTTYAQGDTFGMGSADVTLYPRWTALPTYAVTYAATGADGGAVPVDTTSYLQGQDVTVQGNTGALTREGYAFSGWNTQPDGGGAAYAQAATFTMGSADVVLYAQWTALPTYAVTYDANGATGGSAPVDGTRYLQGRTVTVLANTGNLSWAGHVFWGWSTEPDGGGSLYAPGDTLAMGSASVTLYARWLPTHSVTYDGNGAAAGSVPVDGQGYLPGQTATVPGNTGGLSSPGYSFSGWNTAANGSGTAYTQGDSLTMGGADVTLYAQWTALPTYTISYDANGATGGAPPSDSTHYLQGQPVTVLGNSGALARTGYSFSGWNTQANGSGTAYTPGDTFGMPAAAVTLHAQWTALPTYTVTYAANGATGGSVATDTTHYLAGQLVTVLANTGNLSWPGHAFAGWNTRADGGGTAYAAGDTFSMGNAGVILYAQWTTLSYTLSFDANGGSGTMSAQSLAYGAVAYLPASGFSYTGYIFAGWATSPTGGVAYSDRQSFTMGASDVRLYAVWTAASTLLVHYDFNAQNCTDSSGHGRNGTAHSVAYTSDGNGGYAASFNGASSYIELPYDLVRSQSQFTIMMRFKASPSQYGGLFGFQNTTVGNTPTQYIPMINIRSDGKLYGEVWVGDVSPYGHSLSVSSLTAVNDGNWHTVYFSSTTSSVKLYLDGVAIASDSGAGVNGLSMYYNQIGTADGAGRSYLPSVNGASNSWFYFNGLIDEFFMYSSALQ